MKEGNARTLMPMRVAALILAAGGSRRLGRPKQLLEFEGETLLARTVRLSSHSGAFPVLAVLGSSADQIVASVHSTAVQFVMNQDWEQGIAASIHAGLHALEELAPATQGVILLTCDQPRLTAEHLESMLQEFLESKGEAIIASAYAGTLGTPVIFPREDFAGLYTLKGDQGARSLLKGNRRVIREIPLPGGEIDIDHPADLDLLR